MAKSTKNKKCPKVTYELGEIWVFEDTLHEVRYINCGRAYLAPVKELPGRFVFLADRILDEYGFTASGEKASNYSKIVEGVQKTIAAKQARIERQQEENFFNSSFLSGAV